MTQWLNKTANALELITEWVGRAVSWFVLFMVTFTFVIVVLRYVFNVGWIALQESVIYAHALVFLLGAAFALKHNQHVRVDVFYHRMSPRGKALVDFFGTLLLLLPVSIFILSSSYDYVLESIELKESSREAGGLPYVYLLKTQIITMGVLLIIQATADLLKNLSILLDPTREQA